MSRRRRASRARPPHVCAPVRPGTAARTGLLVSLSHRRRVPNSQSFHDTAHCILLALPPRRARLTFAQGICTHHQCTL